VTRPIKNDESLSIELEEEDLLDIDGSDDPTMAFGGKAFLSKLRAPRKRANGANGANPNGKKRAPVADAVDDPTIVVRGRDDVRVTMPFPMQHATARRGSAPAPLKSPTISPAPPVRQRRNVNSSYPPIAISVGSHRERQMSFISERPSRAGWIAGAILAALIVIGGSIKVAAPKVAPAAAADATPVAAAEPPAPAPEEAKVVTFGDNQGVSIKPKADAKADAKAEAKKPAPHVAVAAKPAPKPAASSKVDNSLAVSKDEAKAPATSHDTAPSSNITKAEQKKLKSIEQDLADLQLKAAAR
jgi:hypothetical protein